MPHARGWDRADGDAQFMAGLADESFDLVFSAHCLEHLHDPLEGLLNWWRLVKPGGHLILIVPDEDRYEQRCWPSAFNPDHKWSFSVSKSHSWSPAHKDLADLLALLPSRDILSLRVIEPSRPPDGDSPFDSTLVGDEACIEAIVQKVPDAGPRWSPYSPLLVCPGCKRLEVILLGVLPDMPGVLHFKCRACGSPSQFNIPAPVNGS